jgi:hypothetical protein
MFSVIGATNPGEVASPPHLEPRGYLDITETPIVPPASTSPADNVM